jgi:hypothetical protein
LEVAVRFLTDDCIQIQRRLTRQIIFVLFIVIGCTTYGCDDQTWTNEQVDKSKKIGDGIVSALNTYQAKEGRYPNSLDALVPKYIPAIDQPIAGKRKWEYQVSPDGSFYNLWFESKDVHPKAYGWSTGRHDWSYDSGE